MRRWSRFDGVTVTLSGSGQARTVCLYRPHQSHVIQKQYEWYEQALALDEALTLAELLNLEEVHEEPAKAA